MILFCFDGAKLQKKSEKKEGNTIFNTSLIFVKELICFYI